jgi:excisionase family DNA binding protein
VGEGHTEGAQQGKEYVTVGEAAKLLGVHRNTIHHRIKNGRIRAHKVLEGDREVYRIERDSLDIGRTSADVRTLDAQRTTAGEELSRMIAARLDEIVRDYTHQLGDLREELGAERARREMAEATLHEGMAEERRRREEAERERDDLRRELYARSEPRESPETVEEEQWGGVEPTSYAVEIHGSSQEATEAAGAAGEQQGRGEPHSAAGGAQEGARRPWWRRMLGR